MSERLWSCICGHLIDVEPSEADSRPMWFHQPAPNYQPGGCTCRYQPGCGGGLPNPNPPAQPTAPS